MSDPLAVIFDVDGVLVDTYQAHFRSWLEVAQEENLQLTEAEFATTFGWTSREVIVHLWGENWFDEGHIAELDGRKEAAFRRLIEAEFPAMPGVQALLNTLHDEGVKLAVGSSAPPENIELVLDRLEAKCLFQAVVTRADVIRGKPDPQVFLLAAERLEMPPAQCVVIEDSPAGVAAANAAGMSSIGLLSTGRTRRDLVNAGLVVPSLDEITPATLHMLVAWRTECA